LDRFLFPNSCGLCGRVGESAICGFCRAEMGPVRGHLLPAIGEVSFRAVLFDYAGRAKQAVHNLKYSHNTALGSPMSELMRSYSDQLGLAYDLVVPIPIHYLRRCERGFNQSELLAERFSSDHVDRRGLSMRRTRYTRPQVELSYQERLQNLRGAFAANPFVSGKRILLVDDVATTGGTARAAAEALLQSGATGVGLIAFAGDA